MDLRSVFGWQGSIFSDPTNSREQALDGLFAKIARDNKIPVVGVSETEPPDSTYQSWMTGQLDALDKALGGATN